MTIFINVVLFFICKIYTTIINYSGIAIIFIIYVAIMWYFDLFKINPENEIKSKVLRVALGSFPILVLYLVLGVASAISDIISRPHIRKGLSSDAFDPYSEAMKIYREDRDK